MEEHPNLSPEINANIKQSVLLGGFPLTRLDMGMFMRFRTKNTEYVIRRPKLDTFEIKGNYKYCPVWTPCKIHGSTWGGSMIKVGFIGVGMHVEFDCGQGTILTSEVQDIALGWEDDNDDD